MVIASLGSSLLDIRQKAGVIFLPLARVSISTIPSTPIFMIDTIVYFLSIFPVNGINKSWNQASFSSVCCKEKMLVLFRDTRAKSKRERSLPDPLSPSVLFYLFSNPEASHYATYKIQNCFATENAVNDSNPKASFVGMIGVIPNHYGRQENLRMCKMKLPLHQHNLSWEMMGRFLHLVSEQRSIQVWYIWPIIPASVTRQICRLNMHLS